MGIEPRKACKWNREYKRDVWCRRLGCAGCGWDPEEHAARIAELREQVQRGETPHVSVQKQHSAVL